MTILEANIYDYDENNKYILAVNQQLGVTIKQPPRLIFNEGKITKRFFKREINLIIENFVQITKSKSPHFNMNTFYNNINIATITLFKSRNYRVTTKSSLPIALYLIKSNKILIYNNNFLPFLYHELYHLCTSIIDQNGTIYSGFSQRNPDGSKTGIGITEGFNALLTKRNFGKDDSYLIEQYFMSIVQNIVGKDLMEQLYSQMNLRGLIEEVRKNDFIEEFIKAVKSIDAIFEPENDKIQNYQLSKSTEYMNVYMATVDMLVKITKNKLKYGILNPKEAEEELSSLLNNQNIIYRSSLWALQITNFITPDFIKYVNDYAWSNLHFIRM